MKESKITHYGWKDGGLLTITKDCSSESECNIVLSHSEMVCLMKVLQGYLPMGVCESSDIKMLSSRVRALEDGDDVKHLNSRLRKAEEKIVTLEGKAQQRFDDIKFLNAHSVKTDESINSLKGLFDRHYGSVACGHCQESKTVARLVCDINCLKGVVEHLKYKLNEATK